MATRCSHCDVYWRPDITETVSAKVMAPHPDPHEERAARWLQARGWQLVARNTRYRGGELDIVARDGEQLVFVEVRRRSNPRFAGAAASVDRRKQRRLLHAAALFLQQHPQWSSFPCRFDVIAFEPPQSGADPEPKWIRAAFSA